MDERVKMINDWTDNAYTVSDLSRLYGVSRKTVYKWLKRFKEGGRKGIQEQSRAPRNHPNTVPGEIIERIISTKLAHPIAGPKKLLYWLEKEDVQKAWPAASTINDILKRQGLVRSRPRRHKTPAYTEPFLGCSRPNQVWSADFKGQFRTRDGKICYPLTISDNYSRYLLLCRGLRRPIFEEVKPWFEYAFRKHGLPDAIRTDNGDPFASVSLGALSKLSTWFIKLGIRPERIQCGHPEQNGRHERLHRTIKEAVIKPPQRNLREQQKAFDRFIQEYNLERPHEALGMRPPTALYQPSLRVYRRKIADLKYPQEFVIRRVRHNGQIKWHGRLMYVSQVLSGERIALQKKDDKTWIVKFGSYPLGVTNEQIKGTKVLPMCPVKV